MNAISERISLINVGGGATGLRDRDIIIAIGSPNTVTLSERCVSINGLPNAPLLDTSRGRRRGKTPIDSKSRKKIVLSLLRDDRDKSSVGPRGKSCSISKFLRPVECIGHRACLPRDLCTRSMAGRINKSVQSGGQVSRETKRAFPPIANIFSGEVNIA